MASHGDPNEHVTLTLQVVRPSDPEPGKTHAEPLSQRGAAAHGESTAAQLEVRERIELRGLHSSGGIGEVWRAYDKVLGREVALKRLRHDKAGFAGNRARFLREAQLTGQLDHPGIVPVYDYTSSEDGRHCYYTMRFLRGRTLSEVVAEFHAARRADSLGLVSSRFLDLLGYFASICNTVAFAHSRGVVHRDLKPDNVIIGDYGEVVVLDWGLGKRLAEADPEAEFEGFEQPAEPTLAEPDPAMTLQGELLGTPSYMAPEQALGWIDRIDQRTDVYGLAAILYEVLTGEPPFRAATLAELIEAVVSAAPLAPSERVAGVPAQLERVCLRGLAKRMHERPASAAELAAEVHGWLTDLAERRRTEQERERFFDLSLDLLAIVDRDGRVEQSNVAWERQLGWASEGRAGQAFLELVEPEMRSRVADAFARIWAGAEQAEVEVRMRGVDRASRWVDWNLRTLEAEHGTIYLVGRDVTERRRAEREVEGLLESAPDATCVIAESGQIVRVNAQLERLFGYSRTELIGQPIEILIPSVQRDRHRRHVAAYTAAPKPRAMGVAMNLHGQRRSGEVFAVEVSLSPVQTEDRLLIACSIRDPSLYRAVAARGQ